MPFAEGICALHPKSQLCTMCPVALYVCSKVQQEQAHGTPVVTPYVLAGGDSSAPAHLFLQRILYKINRMNFFW